MSGDKVWTNTDGGTIVDGFSGATPLAELAAQNIEINSSGTFLQYTKESASYVPEKVIEYSYSISDMFMGYIPGSVSETSVFVILIGAAILIFTGIGSWRTILSVFIGGYIMSLLFNLWGANELMLLPPHLHLILGGFAFGAVFMATDPVTAAQTNKGKYIVGFLIGVFAIIIRVFNPAYPEGMMMAILLLNVFAPLVDHYVIRANINRRLNRAKA
jgi:Na+-transporting NADH:ubiquinone oxidoreductase subunit B